MKYPSNYKKIIRETIIGDWFFLAKRSGCPPLSMWLKLIEPSISEFKKVYGVDMSWICYWHDPMFELFANGKGYRKIAEAAVKIITSPRKFKKHLEMVKFYCNQAKKASKFFYDTDLEKYSNEFLYKKYNKVVKNYSRSFAWGFISWCMQPLQSESFKILDRYRKQLTKIGLEEKNTFGILVTSAKESIYYQKERALEKLCKTYSIIIPQTLNFGEQLIRSKFVQLSKDLEKFLFTYRLVGYDYTGPVMTFMEVLNILQNRSADEIKTISKKEVLKACKFKKSELLVFDIFSQICYIKDLRN